MSRLLRFGRVLSACLSLGACTQLIGLDKYDDNASTTEAGTAAKGGAGGRAGQTEGGRGGGAGTGGTVGRAGAGTGFGGVSGGSVTPGSGGSAVSGGFAGMTDEAGASGASTTGGTGGSGARDGSGGTGARGGTGGTSGTGARGGTGGASGTGGTGGVSNSAGAGGENTGGESTGGCSSIIEITPHGMPTLDDETQPSGDDIPYYDYQYDVDPQLGSPAADYLWLDFYAGSSYDGGETGVFNLGTGDESNYATCSRCVYLGEDADEDSEVLYFAKSGTLDIKADSAQLNGEPDLVLTDVLLTEVTFDGANVSTEVPHGRCLHLASLSLDLTVPAGWTCDPSVYGDGQTCDCGCGVPDPDCSSSAVGACDYCDDYGSCGDYECSEIKLGDNSKCASNQGWTCDPSVYGDGQTCDCGCGVVDVDCASAKASDCDTCDDYGACSAAGTCSDLASNDNSTCN